MTKENQTTDIEQRVADAAAELLRRGEKVTVQAVRSISGGSLRDICPALRKWREGHPNEETKPEPGIPEEVLSILRKAESEIWLSLEKKASDQITAMETLCRSRVIAAEAERDESFEEIIQMESQLDTFTRELLAMRDAFSASEKERQTLITERNGLARKLDWTESALKDEKAALAKAIDQSAELRGRLAAMQDIFQKTSRTGREGKPR